MVDYADRDPWCARLGRSFDAAEARSRRTWRSPSASRPAASAMIERGVEWRAATLLPPEPDAQRAGARGLMPEQRLALAVLENAVATFQRHAMAGGLEFAETRDWLFSDDATRPFTFVNVCGALGLEPHYIRHGLAGWLSHAHAVATRGILLPFPPSSHGGGRPTSRPFVSTTGRRRIPRSAVVTVARAVLDGDPRATVARPRV